MEEENPNYLVWSVIIALVAIFISSVLLYLRKRVSKTDILLVGLCDSGKTLLFSRLCLKKDFVATQTSIQPNKKEIELPKGLLQLVDIPGHERLRKKFLDDQVATAKALIYLIDSSAIQKNIRDVAEYLFVILTDEVLNKNKWDLLILCNKQDQVGAKGKILIKTLLESELNILRNTTSNRLDAIDNSGKPSRQELGDANKKFEFSQLKSINVTFSESSLKQTEDSGLDSVYEWLESL